MLRSPSSTLACVRGVSTLARARLPNLTRLLCTSGPRSSFAQAAGPNRKSCCAPGAIRHLSASSTSTPRPFASVAAGHAPVNPPQWRPLTEECLEERPVLIIGAGNMGRRLALVWASASRPVTVYDTSQDALDATTEYLTDNLGAYCAGRGTHPGHVCTTTDLRIATTTGRLEGGTQSATEAQDIELHSGAKGPWMAVDCLPESLELKAAVLSQMEHLLPGSCILASNSCSLQTREIAAAGRLHHPERLLNTHYFIPPRNRMVELMSSSRTHAEIFPFLAAQMQRVGLAPIIVPVQSQGLVFNRIWAACKRETLAVLAEGVARPADIDALFRDFFHAEKGPCERMDEVGLDRVAGVEKHCLEERPALARDGKAPLDWLVRSYVDRGRLGEKTGDGFFTGAERDALKEKRKVEHYRVVEETRGA
ncbi:hypothetical protein B0T24DRAFT_519758 [Lasiosphaeria ovina]|uniref:3-hydroxyacyl-CoA dehydrogenase n=1 Tax=Lasiosphaeria ovina TaxID=92902 RepID=A0AAE0KMZ3_9PEZI|nr:hypothetical protein B0T24DRAFT_519758 [Lasiosphaeria ovina]